MIALITGASSGIGRAMALGLAKRGFNLIITARRIERLIELKREVIEKYGVKVRIFCHDLSNPNECKKLFEEVDKVNIDVVINSAGFGVFGAFDETDLDSELKMIDVNIKAVHILTKLYLKTCIEKGSGRILNIGSSAGFFSGPLFSSYYASKAYVLHLSEAVAWETRKKGVGVSVFCPGPVTTEFGKLDGISDGRGAISAELAAKRAVDGALRGKRIIYPVLKTRALVLSSRLLPRKLLLKIVEKQQANKR